MVREALQRGAKLDLLTDFDALAALDAAARATQSLPVWRECEILDMPVIIGDPESGRGRPAVLYPPSYAALCWIEDHVDDFFGPQTLRGNLACAWALAHANDPDAFKAASTPRAARVLVKRWSASLNCGIEALIAASRRLLGHEEAEPTEEKPTGTTAQKPSRMQTRLMLARLCHEFSLPEEYFLFGPRDRLNAAIELIRQKDKAERDALAKAEKKKAVQDPDAPEVQAFVRWREVSDAFLERYTPVAERSDGDDPE